MPQLWRKVQEVEDHFGPVAEANMALPDLPVLRLPGPEVRAAQEDEASGKLQMCQVEKKENKFVAFLSNWDHVQLIQNWRGQARCAKTPAHFFWVNLLVQGYHELQKLLEPTPRVIGLWWLCGNPDETTYGLI